MRQRLPQRFTSVFNLVAGFSLGQGALQCLNLFTGLYLVRRLSVEGYAQFGLAFGFQTTMAALMDLGFTGTIIPLVGEQTSDPAHVGRYVRAAKHLRDRTFFIFSPIASVAFLLIMHKHHWSVPVQSALLASVLVALYSGGPVSYFSAPLILYGRLRQYYLPQSISALGRFLLCVALGTVGLLTSWAAAALGALSVSVNAWFLRNESRGLFVWTKFHDATAAKEIRDYILPVFPAVIFSAFQTQIGLILVSIFGQTANIAQVAALGRLAQLFLLLSSFNMIIVEPRIARLPQSRVLVTYLRLAFAGCMFACAMAFVGFRFPQVFLWALGSKYEGLRGLMGWVIATGCVGYVTNLVWVMNRARRWLFWRGTILEIGLTLLVDIGFVVIIGVRTTSEAVFFSLASSLCALCTHVYISTHGFRRGARVVLPNTT